MVSPSPTPLLESAEIRDMIEMIVTFAAVLVPLVFLAAMFWLMDRLEKLP